MSRNLSWNIADSCWPLFACRVLHQLADRVRRGSSLLSSSASFWLSSGYLLTFYRSSTVSRSTPHGLKSYVYHPCVFSDDSSINPCYQQQEFGYNVVASFFYFTAFIVQLSVWVPAYGFYDTSSNVAAGVILSKPGR